MHYLHDIANSIRKEICLEKIAYCNISFTVILTFINKNKYQNNNCLELISIKTPKFYCYLFI